MSGSDATIILSAISLCFNFLMIVIQAKIRAELAELKAHMYEKFLTKREARFMLPVRSE